MSWIDDLPASQRAELNDAGRIGASRFDGPTDNHAAFYKIANHQHHEIEVVLYGTSVDDLSNAAVECRDCNEVIADADRWLDAPVKRQER